MQAAEHLFPVSVRKEALRALCITEPGHKLAATHELFHACQAGRALLDTAEHLTPAADDALPGRPARPELRPPKDVPQRSPFTSDGLAMLLHAVTHIEFNAIKYV
jgi:uncharacterized ferritin-like protein (DUF455 family)